jgi:hypothetical protein
MKITKSQLREIIEDELRKDALQEDYEEEEFSDTPDPEADCDALEVRLMELLETWKERNPDVVAGEYYHDLRGAMVDHGFKVPEEETTEDEPRAAGFGASGPRGEFEDVPIEAFRESIEALVKEMLQGDLEERKKKEA